MDKRQLFASLEKRGFSKQILDAFAKVPRENFVPKNLKERAYDDNALPIGYGQTISQPYTIAMMLELLQLQSSQKVLEIGSGSGYVLALLSELVGKQGKVFGIEIVKELAEISKENLKNYSNVKVYNMNGAQGLQEEDATSIRGIKRSRRSALRGKSTKETAGSLVFDRILISAALEEIPKPILSQLKNNGIIVAPIGIFGIQQSLVAIKKTKNKTKIIKEIPGFVFVRFVQ